MKKVKFSVIMPVHVWCEDRALQLLRAIESVKHQTYGNYELIIVNDGSTMEVAIPRFPWLRVINKSHEERVIAYNVAFKEAKGDWFTLLDSDDEYDPRYLEECAGFIRDNPEYKMFNFGSRFIHKDGGENVREAFCPATAPVGHEIFGGGNIVNGTFIWHRSVYDDLGGYGPKDNDGYVRGIDCSQINYGGVRDLFLGSPYDFSAYYQMKYPELRQFFMVNHEAEPNKIIKEMGNPWGNDHILAYQYTRKYHMKPILNKYIYIVHTR